MKKRIKFFLMLILLLFNTNKVYALEVSKSDLTIKKGENTTVELYVNTEKLITGVNFTIVNPTNDIPVTFTVAPNLTDSNPNGAKHNIVFPESKRGKILLGTVNISSPTSASELTGIISFTAATAKLDNNSILDLKSQTINVKVGSTSNPTKEIEITKEETPNLISEIKSKIVKIELEKDVFEYDVTIKKSIKELDLIPVANDENTVVIITTQKIAELEDNKIVLTAKNGKVEEKYIINVKINENTNEIAIDNEEFKEDKTYKLKWGIISIILIIALVVSILFINKK